MKKFWRSGMIDKKIVREREQEEYINKLNRTILELRRKPPQPEPCCFKHPDIGDLINNTTNYDEVRIGNNVILDFGGERIIATPKESLRDSMMSWAEQHLRDRPRYDCYIEFWNKNGGQTK